MGKKKKARRVQKPKRAGVLSSLFKPSRSRVRITHKAGRVVGVFSCKGGVGKTTTLVNVGTALSQKYGAGNVILVDANLGAPNLGFHFGELAPPVTIHDVLQGSATIEEAILKIQGVNMILGSIAYTEEMGTVDLAELLSPLRQKFKFIMLDTAPGIGSEVLMALRACDEMVIVTNPYVPTIASTLRTFRAAEKYRVPILGVVLNRVAGEPYELPPTDVKKALAWPVIAVIPEDKKVQEATASGIPVVKYAPRSKAAVQFSRLSQVIAKHLR